VLSNVLLGIEGGFKDLGEASYDYDNNHYASSDATFKQNINYDSYAIDALVTLHAYIWQGWNTFVKGGVAVLNTKYTYKYTRDPVSTTNPNLDIDQSFWNLRPEVEVGTGYTFDLTPSMHLDVHIMYEHISTEPDVNTTNVFTIIDPSIHDASVPIPGVNAVLGGIDFSFNPAV
ncbi:unnamed protein product, partial [marine sediment metagenome]